MPRSGLPSLSKNPEPGLVTIPLDVLLARRTLPEVASPDPLQLAQELERWDRGGSHSDADLSTARDHAGASVDRPFTPPSPTVASAMDVLTRETTFRAREPWCPTRPASTVRLLGRRRAGRGLRLCYRWASSRGLDPDGTWSLGEGGEIRDVTLRTTTSAAAAERVVLRETRGRLGAGVVLVANTPEAADEWTASLRAVLGTGSGASAGKGGVRGTVPSPVRRILVPA